MTHRTRLLSASMIIGMLIALVLGAVATTPSHAAGIESMPGTMVELRASSRNEFTRVVPAQRRLAPTATVINVTYTGSWTPAAQTAFQYAVDIWEGYVYSPVVITINASWEVLGTGVLGSAGTTGYWRDFPGAPRAGTWYPNALANALYGSDIDSTKADITARFSSVFNWYLGTDGNTPAGQYDLVSVVLHEIGHGLGFAGSATVSSGQGSWGLSSGYPISYDVYTENGSGTDTINTASFANPSAALASHLQSNDLYWSGAKAMAANGGARPRLYAPTTWDSGSSYSHLNESTYGAGNANSLMTPQIGAAESIHSPGPIGLGILGDIGWPSAPASTATPTNTATRTATATATNTATATASNTAVPPTNTPTNTATATASNTAVPPSNTPTNTATGTATRTATATASNTAVPPTNTATRTATATATGSTATTTAATATTTATEATATSPVATIPANLTEQIYIPLIQR